MRNSVRAALAALMTCAAALVVLAVVARADTPPRTIAAVAPQFYVVALAGMNSADLETAGIDFGSNQLMGGAAVGFNLAMPGQGVVLGIEGDFLLTDIEAGISPTLVSISASTNYLASVRGRLGLPAGPALLYVTGGVAFTDHEFKAPGVSLDKDLVGGVIGAGIEAELGRTLFVRIEGLHYLFPDQDVSLGGTVFDSQNQQTTVRIGIGIKLN